MKTEYKIDAILFEREAGHWVAQCLQYDIGAQAVSLPALLIEIQRVLVGHVVIAIENGIEPFESLPEAPQQYWQMWERASTKVQPEEKPFRLSKEAAANLPHLRFKLAA